jgi:CPA2 family monovalent cation:H+ antiporter-2
MDEVRRDRYHLLHGFYHGASANLLDQQGRPRVLLHAVNLSQDAYACGRSLAELALSGLGVELQGVRREGDELELSDALPLREGDALLLAGPLECIERAEARLLAGTQ